MPVNTLTSDKMVVRIIDLLVTLGINAKTDQPTVFRATMNADGTIA